MPYLISYLKYRAGDTNVRNVDSLWLTTANTPVSVVAFMLGGILHRRFGPRITTTIGAVIFSSSTFLTYFAVQKSLIALAFTQSVMGSFGTIIAYGSSLAVAMQSGITCGVRMIEEWNKIIHDVYLRSNKNESEPKTFHERYQVTIW
ncbi:hypothetical protein CHS0354_021472 [Potamilus streckersoni]|uniref:Uncharacterized protein n=1 Tax=Potamilus streckersoni TaxID=2493646 RepID=A0AAE0S262_9BIVA|nr:hypothetical protein CHS0354_021472 [Potamilus streckersoni]